MSSTHQQLRRGKCCKTYTVKGWNDNRYIIVSQWDGCNRFSADAIGNKENCMACGCHWSFHEKQQTEKDEQDAVFTDCCKNQILKQFFANDKHVKDGCKEFVPGGPEFELICGGCGCHRNFHKIQEISPKKFTTDADDDPEDDDDAFTP